MSEQFKALPEGVVLAGSYEVREHLGPAGDGHLYLAVAGGAARPRAQLLLARPLDAPGDLRAIEPEARENDRLVPAVNATFRAHGQQFLALALTRGEPLAAILPLGNDEEALAVLQALGRGLAELVEHGASCADFQVDRLILKANGRLGYTGPVAPRSEADDPVATMAAAIHELFGAGEHGGSGPWSRDLEELLARLASGAEFADLAAMIAAVETLAEPPQVRTTTGLASDRGAIRLRNEDAALASRQQLLARDGATEIELLAVADGVGGHREGQRAAALTVSSFESSLAMADSVGLLSGEAGWWQDSNAEVRRRIAAAYGAADETVAALAEPGEADPPGSTLVTAVRIGRRLFIAHIGDSRAYLLRNGRLERLTRDDSAVQDMVDRGALTAAEAKGHPEASALLRFIGYRAAAGPRQVLRWVCPGDRWLLCSDGVVRGLSDATLQQLLAAGDDAGSIAAEIVAAARRADGSDNITAAVLDVDSDPG